MVQSRIVPKFISVAFCMSSVTDSFVNVLCIHEVLVVPYSRKVVSCIRLLPDVLLSYSRAQSITQPFDEDNFHLITGILNQVLVVIRFTFQYYCCHFLAFLFLASI